MRKFLYLLLVCTILVTVDSFAGDNKICLTMIVKNESKIIERCLDSVKNIVDCISICDTGSTDDTVAIIENYMQREGIPGKVHLHQWENFGHNRTLSAIAAQETLQELAFNLNNTFLLLFDADMKLEIHSDFDKSSLFADSYILIQKNHSYSYYNTRLIRASLPWHCVGLTHEYWACKVPCREEKLYTLNIDDRDDGGCKSDKFERDIRLLTKGLEEDPNNSRYLFYLANSYKALKQFEEAIKWYKVRIAKEGWYEEVWYSKYMIGECYEEMGKWDQALSYYLEAYQYNSERAEPLSHISKYYLSTAQFGLAYLFAKEGSKIPYPHNQSLFINHDVYNYLFDENISIAAFYAAKPEEGLEAINRLMIKKGVPYSAKEQAYHNILFYVKCLENASYRILPIDLPFIRSDSGLRFNPMNPTIKKTPEGYDVICRTVNYFQIGAKHFKSLDFMDPSNKIVTRNFLLKLDFDFNLLLQQEILENLTRERRNFMNCEGLEDCRMFQFQDSVWFTCTTLDTSFCSKPQISLCKLSDEESSEIVQVEKLIPLLGPYPCRCEKNWLPFVKDEKFHVIYSYEPLVIYTPNIENGFHEFDKSEILVKHFSKYDFSRFSGSAPPIEFDNGYLILVHEIAYEDQRIYMERFVYLDRDFNIKRASKPFIFLHKGIEYCCGMAIDHAEKKLVMSIGIEDREAYLCIVDLNTVRSMLEEL
jgi:glycosyltransferase involved in cell wall biosynthesis/predicted GH43/DUF377 family glycosyl hydrolase